MSRHGTRRSTILKRRAAGFDRVIVGIKRFGLFAMIAACLIGTGWWLSSSGLLDRVQTAALDHVYALTAQKGFAVKNILVDGRHYTDTDALRAILAVERGDPIFAFDPQESKTMLEKLSWVKTAQVERRLPDTIYIQLTERVPIALWQRQKRLSVIDGDGVVLTDQNIAAFKNLMIVVGEDAPKQAQGLMAMLQAEPLIKERVESAVLVSGRRWNLKLKSGAEVKLPADELGLALRRLAINQEEEGILDKDVLSIDVRDEGRITVRTKPGEAQDFNVGLTPASGSPI
jgi:cell division protein FtsQ